MAAATEWLNALAAGAEVVSVRRREPLRRPLNLPARSSPSAASDDSTRRLRRPSAELLAELSAPSYPPGHRAGTILSNRRRGRTASGSRSPSTARTRSSARPASGEGYEHDPLLRRLVEEHGLETHGRWLVLAPDSTVGELTDGTRTLAVAGVHGQWAYPAADTLVGMKYAARRFLRRVEACRTR